MTWFSPLTKEYVGDEEKRKGRKEGKEEERTKRKLGYESIDRVSD